MKQSERREHRLHESAAGRCVSRRRFIRDVSMGAAGLAVTAALPGLAEAALAPSGDLSKVVIARHPDAVLSPSAFDPSLVGELVHAAVTEFTGEQAPGRAWAQIFPDLKASSVIGIEIDCVDRSCSSRPEMAYAIAEGLTSIPVAGGHLPRNNIIIRGRLNDEIEDAGYTRYVGSDPGRVRCFGVDRPGYDDDSGPQVHVNGVDRHPDRIVAQRCDHLVNLAVLRPHSGSEGTFGLENRLETIHDPESLRPGEMDGRLPELDASMRAELGEKVRLTVIDGLVGVVSGGSGEPSRVAYGGLILGADPVATGRVGRQVDMMEENPIPPATRGYVDRMIRFHREGLATALQVEWALNRYARGK